MNPPSILSNFAAVGNAVWLYQWILIYTRPANTRWQIVANGEPMSDERIAVCIDVSASMVRRWREKLTRLGYVKVELVRPRHRKFYLVNPAVEEVPDATNEVAEPAIVN